MPLLKKLNKEQNEAVTHSGGPLLILAGAGSGKTRTLTHRIAYLIDKKNISPYNILAVTFTNKAADEVKSRVSSLVKSSTKDLWIGTFHSIGYRILRKNIENLKGFYSNFTILDEQDQTRLIKECIRSADYNESIYDPKRVRGKINSLKQRGLKMDDLELEIKDNNEREIIRLYESEMRKNNTLDFADLLNLTVRLFSEYPEILAFYQKQFEYILVDEYQDTNHLQYLMVKLLAQKSRNIFVVGDDNQSIYSWRGADINNILNFENDFEETKVVKLEKNYRSSKNILHLSNELIKNNLMRKEKTLYTDNPQGDHISYYRALNGEDEALNLVENIYKEKKTRDVSYKDIAVFYRTHHQSKMIEDELIKRGIPYVVISGTGFYQRAEIKDIISYLRLIKNPADDLSLKRIINVPSRKLGRVTMNSLELISQEHRLSIFDSIEYCLSHQILSTLTRQRLEKFHEIIKGLINDSKHMKVAEIIKKILNDTKYLDSIKDDEDKKHNLSNLVNFAEEFDCEEDASLESFLDWVALASRVDSLDNNNDKVNLMTLHAAKGLEFPVVFITGLEEGLLPHSESKNDRDQMEEERRILYVGITRAKEKLYLSSAAIRQYFGNTFTSGQSRFIAELPENLIDWTSYNPNFRNRENLSYQINQTKDRYQEDHEQNTLNNSDLGIKKGQEVSHNTFGNGIVVGIEGVGDTAKVTVSFKSVGSKKVLASFLK